MVRKRQMALDILDKICGGERGWRKTEVVTYLFSLEKIIMKKNSNKTEKLPQITAEEVQALVAALKQSGTKAGTGDQIKEVRKSR